MKNGKFFLLTAIIFITVATVSAQTGKGQNSRFYFGENSARFEMPYSKYFDPMELKQLIEDPRIMVVDTVFNKKYTEFAIACPDCPNPYSRWIYEVSIRDFKEKEGIEIFPPVPPASKTVSFEKVDTFIIRPFIPPKLEAKKYGMHFFTGLGVSYDFRHVSPINKALTAKVLLGITTRPDRPQRLGYEGHLGFFPAGDFKSVFNAPFLGSNPGLGEGYCDCDPKERNPELSLGLSAWYRIQLGRFLGGEWGIMPKISIEVPITGSPVPESEDWALPTGFVIGAKAYALIHPQTEMGVDTKSILFLTAGSGAQILSGANSGLNFEVGINLSFDTGLSSGNKKSGKK